MAALDKFHQAVKQGLQKQHWLITHEPLALHFGTVDLYVDLGAEKLLAAQRGEQKIAVEVKSFLGNSVISEFHLALGQFLNYRSILYIQEPDRVLYLAVPLDVYETFFLSPFAQIIVQEHGLKLIVYDPLAEEIVAWKE